MSCPLSVLMTVHNGVPHIREAVASVLKQTYSDFEVIVVDNNSTDQSVAIVESFADPKIKLVPLDRDIGRTPALNLALRQARGHYVAILDADDLAYRKRLALQVRYLDTHPEVALVGGRVDWFDIYGGISQIERFLLTDVEIAWDLIFSNPLAHSSIAMRREAVLACGGYDEAFRYTQDYELYCEMMRRGLRLACIREKVGAIRLSPTSLFNVNGDLRRLEVAETRRRNLRHFLPNLSRGQLEGVSAAFSGRTGSEEAVSDAIVSLVQIYAAVSSRQPTTPVAINHIRADLARRIACLGWSNRETMPQAARLADWHIQGLVSGRSRHGVYGGLSEACLNLAFKAGSLGDRRQFTAELRRALSFASYGVAPFVCSHMRMAEWLVTNTKMSFHRRWWMATLVCGTLAFMMAPLFAARKALSLLSREIRRAVGSRRSQAST